MQTDTTIKLDSIDAYNKLYGLTTLHPLVTVIDLKKATKKIDRMRINYGVYALFLKNGVNCTLKYGREYYDYQEGTIVSFYPGQVIDVDSTGEPTALDVVGLMFHPDLICGTPLASKIGSFGFFSYSQREALHLSEAERKLFLDCLAKISLELEHPVDNHSADLISANIQLLLEYMSRFYDRQFITRHKVNSSVVAAFEKELSRIYSAGATLNEVPKVSYFADKANLTPGYFGDLIKRETGSSPQDIIKLYIINEAKRRLASTDADISVIAYDLGFQYPQHFTRLFKRVTGKSPIVFRNEFYTNN
ncbi:MAG TPA: helix-turn-helix domain-containing protein [Muribaculum sp.]|jgi:AraC-like DNA-binding protein|uniref:Helix-turn-helix domain-containing protein n=1 Tax=Heminiphilus faecis TaxID=2601703 RepID=A0ABV4D2Q6_9BACT|nr:MULTISPECIES: helix-turn-helix domain-containing protein [Bacteroidales]RLT76350.1 AraC family transcriptional regulator [bacterium J10(2018)]HRF69771.1 helix-turn-helix domain-containing protein [Muribaculum sp.]